ncbi:MAG: PhzF family phenazine biosynthesis protein [Candidatus Eremiobacteraeota bacterium]|nr:PhzF family phenazine biosynthesis protein [Candidatus Eremiobacteraeota bacterium]
MTTAAETRERRYDYVLLDVFTKTRLQGNPLAVFPRARGISDSEMQRIAGELNLSETVFFLEPTIAGALAKARIFTPRQELDFAGHPTVGSAYVLHRRETHPGSFAIEEKVGLVPIDVETDETGDSVFWLTTPKITFFETLDAAFCAQLLNLSSEDFVAGVSPQFLSAGNPFLFVCLKTPEAVDRAEIQHAYLKDALGSVNSTGTYVFSRKVPDSDSNFDVYSRLFAPQTGITEDAATGSATGPVAAYMWRHGLLPRKDSLRFTSEQGTKMGRRSLLYVRVAQRDDDVQVKIGGCVVQVGEGNFFLDAQGTGV